MTNLKLAGQSGALDATPSNAEFRAQIAALTDMMRQMGGNASVVAGALAQADPLSSPFTLYVNPYIGSDKFVGGSYNSHEDGDTDEEIIASKLKRIELQRLECGYSPFRPFKTINRAAIEAAIITSKDWYTYTDPKAHVDCVTIVLSGGVHVVYNDPGSSTTNLATWGTDKNPTIAELISFNPVAGGVLLPRGCSLHGQDLRKTSIRPNWVTSVANELADYSNRRSILKITGTGFFFNATTMDKIGHTESCHLLDTFHPASKQELDAFYEKCNSAVGTGGDLATALLQTRSTEHEIVGPIDLLESPSSTWDTTAGASPYIFNWSTRSEYGIGGAFWDGDKISGLKSMVCANFTGTNQQKDMRCWQVYEDGNWVTLSNTAEDYQKYIDTPPDNLRRHPSRLTRHVSAVNDAFIQEVSVFGIGQSEINMTDNGGEITITNSNSTFGGCAAISKGYKRSAFPKDQNWSTSRIKVPLNISEKTGNVRRIYLGTVAAVSSDSITLVSGLTVSEESSSIPAILLQEGYSLAANTKIWVDNPVGADWRTTLDSGAWDAGTPNLINTTGQLLESGTNNPAGTNPSPIGKRVYIRRIVDTRSSSERRLSLILSNTASARLPQRNFVLQTDPARSGGAISRVLAGGGEEVLLVTAVGVGPTPGPGVSKTSEITIRRGAPSKNYQAGAYYPAGTIVKYNNKHLQAKTKIISAESSPNPNLWGETYVHMPSDFNPEDYFANESPSLIIDTDTAETEDSTTLGINWTTIWTSSGSVRDQYRSGSDYLGAFAFLSALGFSATAAHNALVPQVQSGRERDPNSSLDFPVAPSGGAATGRGYWAVEFRRPSVLRLYGHAWEWAGFGNYSKALPAVQQDMSDFNKFTYYFTNVAGGRVVPQGSNEDGYNITPRGLEDIETGATTSLENLGTQDIDESQTKDFVNINVTNTATIQNLEIGGTVSFPESSAAKTTDLGPVKLAEYDQIIKRPGQDGYEVANGDPSINGNPEVITLRALNRWRIAQGLISSSTDTVVIFVQEGAQDRSLDQMYENPPTDKNYAVPTLARASEYANAVIGGGNQTAEIRIGPGLYSPSSVWQCKVKLVAYQQGLVQPQWLSNSAGTETVSNNYFDGSGYGEYGETGISAANSVNFYSFAILLRPSAPSGGAFHVNCIPLNMRFNRDVDFEGGFHYLGLPHIIKAVSDGRLSPTSFIYNQPGFVYPALGAYTDDLDNNVDTLLNAICDDNGRTPNYQGWTAGNLMVILGGTQDQVTIRDCVFGPGLPSRKDSLGGTREPLINIQGQAEVGIRNIYIRGKTKITTNGMFAGISGSVGSLPQANAAHYGSAVVSAPWTWTQTYHTFIGTRSSDFNDIKLRLGGSVYVDAIPSSVGGFSYYEDKTAKKLPNHIHLLTSAGGEPAGSSQGPYFDQFIHAPSKLSAVGVWQNAGEEYVSGSTTTRKRLQGFVGKFGSNGYNSTLTRGVLGGNVGVEEPEIGFTFVLPPGAGANGGRSIFQVAGIGDTILSSEARPLFDSLSTTAGEGRPVGDNPAISSAALYGATGTSSLGLNVALRSYKLGISVTRAISIPSSNVIL